MTPTNDTAEPRVVIRYPNLSGAHVTVTEAPGTSEYRHSATCTGCLEARGTSGTWLDTARTWASEHAATCRALPQPDGTEARWVPLGELLSTPGVLAFDHARILHDARSVAL
jgi:hypothetical protein